MKLWPFQKKAHADRDAHGVTVLEKAPEGQYDLVIPITADVAPLQPDPPPAVAEPEPEAFSLQRPVFVTLEPEPAPELLVNELLEAEPLPLPAPAADTPIDVLGDLYGEAYDLADADNLFPDLPKVAMQVPDKPAPVLEVEAPKPVPASVRRLDPVVPPAPAFGNDHSYDQSLADALDDFGTRMMLEDCRFMKRSLDDLVARYFAQSDLDDHEEAV